LLIFKDFFEAEIGRKNAEHTISKSHILSKIQFKKIRKNLIFISQILAEKFK